MKLQEVELGGQGGVTFGGARRNPSDLAYVFGIAARGRVLMAALSDGTVRPARELPRAAARRGSSSSRGLLPSDRGAISLLGRCG